MHRSPASRILVSIPHSGVLCPAEIPLAALSDRQRDLAENVDWHTDKLYDFRDLLHNRHVVFPISQVYVNVNRHPAALDGSVPLSVDGVPVYQPGRGPSADLRARLLRRYHVAYHRALAAREKLFILDGHSTVTGHRDAEGSAVADDIILSDWQQTPFDPPGGIRTAPPGYLDTYAEELDRRLAGRGIKVAKNTTYCSTYGHVMAAHGWDGAAPQGTRAPLLLQETNEALYINSGTLDTAALEFLRRVFAESLAAMMDRLNSHA